MGHEVNVGDVVKLIKRNRINNSVTFEAFRGIVIAKGDRKAIIRTNKNKKIVGLLSDMDKIITNEQTILHSA